MRHFVCKTNTTLKFDVCGQLISPDGFLHHRRTFNQHVLIVVLEGVLHITANGTEYSLIENDYIFFKAGEEHFGTKPSEGRLSYLWVHFQADSEFEEEKKLESVLNPMYTSHSGNNTDRETYKCSYFIPESGRVDKSGRVSQLFHQLMDFSIDEPDTLVNMTDYALSLLIMEISREYIQSHNMVNNAHPLALSAIVWIKDHYREPFTIAEIASELGYNQDYLSNVFKRSIGTSISKFTNNLRIRNAKILLSNYDLTVKEAAYSCGFSDEKYFMKVFKESESCTPTQYKNAFGRKFLN